jgi:toxoflavin biosynthesis protein ToxC
MNATASSNGVHQDRGFGHHRGPVTCAAGIPGTRLVITSAYDSAVGLFDLDSGTVDLLGYHEHLANRIVVNAAGSLAASSSSDYTIRLWDSEHRRLERVLLGHSDDVEDFAFVDETTGVSVARDWRILVWDLATGAVTRVLEGHEKDVLSVVSFGGRLYTSGDDMTLRPTGGCGIPSRWAAALPSRCASSTSARSSSAITGARSSSSTWKPRKSPGGL